MQKLAEKYKINRDCSLISGCKTENLFTIRDFPINMMSQEKDYYCDLDFEIGVDDGFVQLKTIINGEKLYVDTHSNAIGKTWELSRKFAAEIIKKVSADTSSILEIGGGYRQAELNL